VGGYDEEANRFLDAAGLVAWIEAERGPEVTRLHLLDGAAERSWRRWHHTRTARLEAVDRVLVLLDLELAHLPEANPLEPNRLSNGPPPDSAVVPRFRYRIEGVQEGSRMRPTAATLTILLMLGVAVSAQAKPKKVRVDTDVAITGYDVDFEPALDIFVGEISSLRRKCLRRRTIHLEQTTLGLDAGTATSNRQGEWEVAFDELAIRRGAFVATAAKRKYRKRRHGEVKRVVVCKRATSPVFDVR
jgi:hypothetical protein